MPLIDLSRQTNLTVDAADTLTVNGTLDVNTLQIDSTEVTATAAQLNQLADNIFTANVEVGSNGATKDLKVWGDLDVQGTTTTIDSTVIQIADPIMQINYTDGTANTGADAGIHVGRNGSTDASLIWDESATEWIAGVSGSESRIYTGAAPTYTSPIAEITGTTGGLMADADAVKFAGIASGAEVNVDTNLGYTASTRVLTSSTGTDVTLPEADGTNPGLMSDTDKDKLDGVASGAQVNVATNLSYTASTGEVASSTGTNVTIPEIAWVNSLTNAPAAYVSGTVAKVSSKNIHDSFHSTGTASDKSQWLAFVNGMAVELAAITSIVDNVNDIDITFNASELDFSLESGDEIMLWGPMA